MERIKNLISPRARRKKLDLGAGDVAGTSAGTLRTFGVPLEQLMARMPLEAPVGGGPRVPFVVRRICEYIYKHGLDNVGLFRVSGSVRVVERLRLQFELTGDVNLEHENDVAATAGLLRVFLRDLPDTLVSQTLTPKFFNIVQGDLDKDETLAELKKALSLLPEENYNVLKYISSLLVVVAENEAENKMSAYSLAILFGPNIFRYELTSGMGGLRDMDSSKEVMQLFISHYDTLFAEEGELLPKHFWDKSQKRKSPPPRPPPPKVQSMPSFKTNSLDLDVAPSTLISSSSSSALDYRPVPSPRKMKNVLEISHSLDLDGPDTPALTLNSGSVPLFSPREDVDNSRPHSPFALESETHSVIESPMVTARTNEFVEKTIVLTISEHIFGNLDFNQNSGPHSPGSPKNFEDIDILHGSPVDLPVAKPRQTLAAKSGSSPSQVAAGSSGSHKTLPTLQSEIEDFDDVERSGILRAYAKPSGPPRRMPSRKHRQTSDVKKTGVISVKSNSRASLSKSSHSKQSSGAHSSNLNHFQNEGNSSDSRDKENQVGRDFWDVQPGPEEDTPPVPGGSGSNNSNGPQGKDTDIGSAGTSPNNSAGKGLVRSSENRALTPQSLSVLNSQEFSSAGLPGVIHTLGSTQSSTLTGVRLVERSPTNGIKLFIPPLDFSTLHEHGDGTEPIPATKSQFDSQIWVKTSQLAASDETNPAVISPRSHKMKKKNGASTNTDIPPSPPIQQDIYKKHSDDECSYRLRQLTKRISGLKKKIKSFEEAFEGHHGYKPSQGERAAQPDIKKYMGELSKARKDLKRLKEMTEKGNRSRHNSGASSSGVERSPPATPTVASTLEFILRCLLDKRRDAGRPEEVMLMSREQVMEEKLAVQRALLHFEGLHGRPSTREEKDLMRPLYDRYRAVKRILAKPMSPRNSLELQTVPEDQMIEIPRYFSQRNVIRIPTAPDTEREDAGQPDASGCSNGMSKGVGGPPLTSPVSAGGGEFGLVTQDLGLLREIEEEALASRFRRAEDLGKVKEEDEDEGGDEGSGGDSGRPENGGGSEDSGGGEANLHELSLPELHAEIETSRSKKKRLRRVLKDFEEEFFDMNGRKVQKEDRYPLQSEYSQYKKVKARLRLLEALVLKHHE